MKTFREFINIRSLLIIVMSIGLLACNNSGTNLKNFTKPAVDNSDQSAPDDNGSSDENGNVDNPEPTNRPLNRINFCSRLELASIRWPSSLSEVEIDSYALALNITGSYEGHSDWKNISNNFDDQGISLGIFQQNLGQGSLQPLLIEVAQDYEYIYRQFFNRNQTESIFDMLEDWDANSGLGLASVQSKLSRNTAGISEAITDESLTNFYSPLDIEDNENIKPREVTDRIFAKASNSKNQRSVNWAIKNLYERNGRTFKSEWKRSFQGLAGDPRYVSKQVRAGHTIHNKAMRFMEIYKAKELKSYLFFFDIVVQNGGIRESTRQKYLAEVNQTPSMSENDRMKVLIKHRVLRSRAQYRADVLSRKLTILNGKGRVHKRNRDLRSEFCTSQYDELIK